MIFRLVYTRVIDLYIGIYDGGWWVALSRGQSYCMHGLYRRGAQSISNGKS